jgi:hypothetical protein
MFTFHDYHIIKNLNETFPGLLILQNGDVILNEGMYDPMYVTPMQGGQPELRADYATIVTAIKQIQTPRVRELLIGWLKKHLKKTKVGTTQTDTGYTSDLGSGSIDAFSQYKKPAYERDTNMSPASNRSFQGATTRMLKNREPQPEEFLRRRA